MASHHHKSAAALLTTHKCPNPSQRRLFFLFQFFLWFALVVCRSINGASENANGQWLSFFDSARERERKCARARLFSEGEFSWSHPLCCYILKFLSFVSFGFGWSSIYQFPCSWDSDGWRISQAIMDTDTVRSWLAKHKLRAVGVYFFPFQPINCISSFPVPAVK
jgi:hypothetical protein